jgi:hypothetical protein
MMAREELPPGTEKVELFLSDLAMNRQVAALTRNQTINALLSPSLAGTPSSWH